MTGKTLIICSKPFVAKALKDFFDEKMKEIENFCYENEQYVITYHLFIPQFLPGFDNDEFTGHDSEMKALLNSSFHFEYKSRDGDLKEENIQRFKRLFSRSDIRQVIWYSDTGFPAYIYGIVHLRRELWPILKPEYFCVETYDERDNMILPTQRIEGIAKFIRRLSEVNAIDISNKIMALYFTRVINLLYSKIYNELIEMDPDLLEATYVQGFRMVYENVDRHYTTGTIILEFEKFLEHHKIPHEFIFFPITSFSFVQCIDDLDRCGLIKVKNSTQKISHTELGSRMYKIIKEYLPDYIEEKNYAHWLKCGKQILTGKIQAGEYIQETRDFIRDSIEDIDARLLFKRD